MQNNLTPHTRYHVVNLPSVEIFPCSKKDIQQAFKQGTLEWVSLGGISKKFEFDSRCHHRPKIDGQIIAALTVSRENVAYLCVYPIRKEHYTEKAKDEFKSKIIHSLATWISTKLKRSQTEIVETETLLIEWKNNFHKKHEIKYL